MWSRRKMTEEMSLPMPSDWQSECEDTNERVGRILQKKQWTDCSFLVGSETTLEVKAHKLILAVASPVFEAMFYGLMAEQDPYLIRIPDIEPGVFRIMLRYIYTNKLKIDTKTEISYQFKLYLAAQKYMLPKLMKKLLTNISNCLSGYNACMIYEFGLFNNLKQLITRCENMIMLNTENVLASTSFLKLSIETVTNIFSFDVLYGSELILVEAAERYNDYLIKSFESSTVKSDVHQQGDAVSVPIRNLKGKKNRTNNKKNGVKTIKSKCGTKVPEEKADRLILPILHKIRLLTLSHKELAENKSLTRLLTKDELYAVWNNASADPGNNTLSMPDGFSTNTNQRSKYGEEAIWSVTFPNMSQMEAPLFQATKTSIVNSKWHIQLQRRHPVGESPGLWVFLTNLGKERLPAGWSCYAVTEFKLLSHKLAIPSKITKMESMCTTEGNGWGRPIISWEELMKIESPYVKDDSITIDVHVVTTSEIQEVVD